MRESGILFPIFSLPSKYGVGSFSKEAYDFVDFLEKSGQGYWQILPVGPTGFGNSPYQPFSAFAGNPYFISLDSLVEEGYLTEAECREAFFGNDIEKVDYGALYENRLPLLRKAFQRFMEECTPSGKESGEISADALKSTEEEVSSQASTEASAINSPAGGAAPGSIHAEYAQYKQDEKYWLLDYALFMALKNSHEGASWLTWEDPLRSREEAALAKAKEELADEIEFYCFIQFVFDRQWKKLRAYANAKQVKIIGDLPFYVSLDSVDAWAHPEVFQMDKDLVPTVVAGCPPDVFSATGQLWGNPIYDWEGLKKADYNWWVRRMQRNYEFYDVIRIDHFHGFCDYYAIPYGDKTAEKGTLKEGPGYDFFQVLEKKIGTCPIIAEDLGNVTPENEKLLLDTGFPGMKVLQFGFTSWDSVYMTHKHIKNCVVYTGTHDNPPTRAWIEQINDQERDFTRRYVNSMNSDYGQLTWDIIREAYRSVADLCIIPLQDYLCKGNEARINTPGTGDGNWEWRLLPNFLSEDLARSIHALTALYGRLPKAAE